MGPQLRDSFGASFVRLRTGSGAVVGAGFLISDRHVLTCAHVVIGALRDARIASSPEPPQGTIHLDFPFLGAAGGTAKVAQNGWFPLRGPNANPQGDVAVLELTSELPPGAQPARLTLPREPYGQAFRAYGFPQGHDAGVWAYGLLRDRLGNGWVQVEDDKEPGKAIEPGFSGGPVEDRATGAILGMVVAAAKPKVGFVIPADLLVAHWPAVRVVAERRRLPVPPPPLPPNFVPRPEDLDKVRQAVLTPTAREAMGIVGLRGMAGSGKTSLAIALCHDEEIQDAFPDGAVWVTLGREVTNLADKLRQVGEALGDAPGAYERLESGTQQLGRLLQDRAVLLVLDDVWEPRHLQPFRVAAPRSRILFTTRLGTIAQHWAAPEVVLRMPTDEQAVMMLRNWAGRHDPALPEIADRLGYLPLALRIAGGQLAEGKDGKEWLADFQQVSQLRLDFFSTDPQQNLRLNFELSVQDLPEGYRRLYYALGIFPEDTAVPQRVVAMLWQKLMPQLRSQDAVELAASLERRGLIGPGSMAARAVSLHDLLVSFTRECLGDQEAATHAALLEAYNPRGAPWPKVQHDGYLYQNLAHHLRGAGRKEDLYALLTGSPDWMEASFVALSGNTSYAADLEQAIGDFRDPVDAGDLPMLVKLYTARQVVSAKGSTYSTTMLRALAWLGREEEAKTHAQLSLGFAARADCLLTIHEALAEQGRSQPSLLDGAEAAARSIRNPYDRMEVLAAVALALARAGREDEAGSLLAELEDQARSLPDFERPQALAAVARALAQAGRFAEAEDAARSLQDDVHRPEVLAAVALALSRAERQDGARRLFADAEGAARSIREKPERAGALAAVALVLAEAGRQGQAGNLLAEAEKTARSVRARDERATALALVAKALAQAGQTAEAEHLAGMIRDERWRAETQTVVAMSLAQAGQFAEAESLARSVQNDYFRAEALATVAKALAQAGRFVEAESLARSVQNDYFRAEALATVAIALAQTGRLNQARILLAAAEELGYSEDSSQAMGDALEAELVAAVAGALARVGQQDEATSLFAEALDLCRSIQDEFHRAEALAAVAKALAQAGQFAEAESLARSVQNDYFRAEALATVAKALAQAGRFVEAESLVRSIQHDYLRTEALAAVATALAQAGRWDEARSLLGEAEAIAGSLSDIDRPRVLAAVAQALALAERQAEARSLFAEAEQIAHSLSEFYRPSVLAAVAQALALAELQDEARRLFAEAESLARSLPDFDYRARMVAAVSEALARAGWFAEAEDLAHSLLDDREEDFARLTVADALAQAGNFAKALAVMGPHYMDVFLRVLVAWAPGFERPGGGLSMVVLAEATRVAGWLVPRWRDVYAKLSVTGAVGNSSR